MHRIIYMWLLNRSLDRSWIRSKFHVSSSRKSWRNNDQELLIPLQSRSWLMTFSTTHYLPILTSTGRTWEILLSFSSTPFVNDERRGRKEHPSTSILQSSWRRYKNIPRTGHKRFPVSNKKPRLINSPVPPGFAGKATKEFLPRPLERRGISSITRSYISGRIGPLGTYSKSRDEINSNRHFSLHPSTFLLRAYSQRHAAAAAIAISREFLSFFGRTDRSTCTFISRTGNVTSNKWTVVGNCGYIAPEEEWIKHPEWNSIRRKIFSPFI